jgi:hypothetical protein
MSAMRQEPVKSGYVSYLQAVRSQLAQLRSLFLLIKNHVRFIFFIII